MTRDAFAGVFSIANGMSYTRIPHTAAEVADRPSQPFELSDYLPCLHTSHRDATYGGKCLSPRGLAVPPSNKTRRSEAATCHGSPRSSRRNSCENENVTVPTGAVRT